ncbi:TNF receptor-associated factor 4-like [Dysidea avara]|uniref:TNF receptor-associated factor 4-like n=1 Tax=Dysidea avara TaxID=196820 RepID=UPI003320BF6A
MATPTAIIRTMECKLCHNQSEVSVTSTCCGHAICKCCLEGTQKDTYNVCPICLSKEFSFCEVCTNKDKGCDWQGEMSEIANHLASKDGCQFEEVTCSNDCSIVLQQQCLPNHVEDGCLRRRVDCQYCHIVGECQFIENYHKEQCPKFPVSCPNKCSDSIPREDIGKHKTSCPLEEVTCTNNCGTILQRCYLSTHAKIGCLYRKVDCKHCHVTGQHQFIDSEHKEQCPKLPVPCPNKCEVGKVPRDDVEEHKKMCSLELIHCEYHELGCEERVARKNQTEHNKEKMEEHLSFMKQKLSMTNQELTDTKQQLATACHDLKKAQEECTTLVASTEATLTKLQAKITEIETASYNRIVELETKLYHNTQQFESILTNPDINWLATLYSRSSKLPSSDQVLPVFVKMSEYMKKRQGKIHWYSEPFYTHPKGYKLCFQGCLGTDHLSVGLLLMKGPYDNLLMWPLVGDFEVKLLNQRKNSEHFLVAGDSQDNGRKRVLMKEKSSYFVWFNDTFICHDDLSMTTEAVQYLRNDTIFFYCKM